MKPVLCISWLLLVPMTVFAQTDHIHSPSKAEDCAKLSPALQAVIGAMDGEGLRIEAVPKPESTHAVEPGIHKLAVALRPLSEVELVGKVSITTRKILLAGVVGEHTSGRGADRDGRVRSLKRRQYGKTQPGIDASGPGCSVHRS